MRTKTKYTQKEIDIIVEAVKESPTNLTKAFEIAAKTLRKDIRSIKNYYYNNLKKQAHLFAITGVKQQKSNTKNTARVMQPSEFSFTLTFDNIKNTIMSMSKTQKQEIFKSLVAEVI
jgi:hypothetical protein